MNPPDPNNPFLDDKTLIRILLGILGIFILAMTGTIWTQEQQTQTQLNQHILDAAQKAQFYVRKDDLAEVNARLQRIEDKLDQKADRSDTGRR